MGSPWSCDYPPQSHAISGKMASVPPPPHRPSTMSILLGWLPLRVAPACWRDCWAFCPKPLVGRRLATIFQQMEESRPPADGIVWPSVQNRLSVGLLGGLPKTTGSAVEVDTLALNPGGASWILLLRRDARTSITIREDEHRQVGRRPNNPINREATCHYLPKYQRSANLFLLWRRRSA